MCYLFFLQVDDGYFVHYFAPRGLPVVPKDVIFVIDISGSMIGTKIKQVASQPPQNHNLLRMRSRTLMYSPLCFTSD